MAIHQRILRLDGVRALAILMVFMTHTGFMGIGWVGVDLFFVLSGYLITGILRRQRTERHFWSTFYAKRAARILPPLMFAFIGAALFASVAWKTVAAYEFLFLANFGEVLHPGASKTLAVLWSLAIEEQFYLLWPFAIRFLTRTTLLRLLMVLLILSPILRAVATPFTHSYGPTYYLTIFRLDGLAAGSLLALLGENAATFERVKVWSGKVLGSGLIVFALLSLLPGFHRDANSVQFNSVAYSLIALCSVSLVGFLLTHPVSKFSKAFEFGPVVFLGAISYGVYLFHPLFLLLTDTLCLRYGIKHFKELAPLAFVLTLAFSWASFRWWETPIIAWGRRKMRGEQQDRSLSIAT
jgi:peptidoglycan/LPS O-acetylase OafA/YrhL